MINYALLFITALLPNIMRQLVYLKSYKKSGSFGFCVSYETRRMWRNKWLPWSGILEELGWASIWTIFWYLGWEWVIFGWVSDALLDCAIAYSWAKGKQEPKVLFSTPKGPSFKTFFLREVLLPYLIIGPVMFLLGVNIFLYSITAAVIGLILYFKT